MLLKQSNRKKRIFICSPPFFWANQLEPLISLFYWKNPNQEEVDFVVKEGLKVKQLIQVCYNTGDDKVNKRELRALKKAMIEFKLKQGIMITEDHEAEEVVNGITVKYIPLWRYLLD